MWDFEKAIENTVNSLVINVDSQSKDSTISERES